MKGREIKWREFKIGEEGMRARGKSGPPTQTQETPKSEKKSKETSFNRERSLIPSTSLQTLSRSDPNLGLLRSSRPE